MLKQRTALIILILAFFLAACANSQAKEIQSTPMLKLDLAFVEDVNVSQKSAGEIILEAHGKLPDACTKIEKSDVEHVDGAIIVSIFTSRTEGTDCGSAPVDFNEEILINMSNAPGISNTIIVNGTSAKIDIPERETNSLDTSSTSSPTPDSQASASEEVMEDDPAGSQIDPLDNQSIATTTEAPNPTQVAGIATEQPSEEAEATQKNEADSTQSNAVARQTEVPAEPDPETAQCEDKASFYADVTVPDNTVFKPGDKFEKIWRVRNEGSCNWNNAYTLVFASGEIMNGALSNPLPEVPPGEIAEISIDLQAPARWGQYGGNWQFQNDRGVRFGVGAGGHDYIWVQIFVDSPAPPPTTNPPAGPPSDQPSQSPVQNPAGCDAQRNDSFEQQVLAMVNNARSSQGLNSLTWQPQLSNAAYRHSSDMACQDFVGHSGSDASSWYDRVSAQGYANFNSARENIYVGDPQFGGTPEGAFDWWMNSQVHKDNILNPDVAEIGIGYSYNPTSSFGGYFTIVFARP